MIPNSAAFLRYNPRTRSFRLIRTIFTLALLVCAAFGQVATLTGRITDATGAIVPQAQVIARSVDTGVSTTAETTADGYYTLPSLPPGRYEVTISKSGFTTVKQAGLELTVQQMARLDVVL